MPDPTQELSNATRQLTEGVRELQSLISRISADVGGLVRLYQPAAFKRLELAINDLNASIGRALLPVLERFRVLIRGIGDGIASLTPSGRAMIAGLVAGGIAMASLTAATIAFSFTVNSALGGIPALLGTIAGAATGVAFALKDFAAVQEVVQKVARAGTILFNTLGNAAVMAFDAISPVIDILANAFASNAKVLSGFFARLGPALAVAADAVSGLVSTLAGMDILTPLLGVVQSLISVVTPLLKPLAMFVSILAQAGAVVASIGSTGIQLVLTALQPAFTVLGVVLETLLAPIQLIAEAFNEVREAFDEVMVLLRDVMTEVMTLLRNELKAVLPDLVGPLQAAAAAIKLFAEKIREFVREARLFLGLPEIQLDDTFKKGRGQGMAVRSTSVSSVQADIQKAQLAALAAGRKEEDPVKKTASNTGSALKILERIERLLINWPKGVGEKAAAAVGRGAASNMAQRAETARIAGK